MKGPAFPTSALLFAALEPPPGVTPNLDHPPSLAHISLITVGICAPTVTIFFLLRVYVRLFIKKTWIFEDWLTTTAWAGTIAYCGIMAATMAHGGGKHAWDITPDEAHAAAYWFNVAAIEYGVMICITKLAVLWLYRRVFVRRRWCTLDVVILSLVVVLVGFYGATTFVKIFECSPRAKISDQTIPGHCVDLSVVLKTSGSFNFITDFLILFLPIHAVWKLKMSKQKKMLIIFVFTFGLCAPIFATIGFVVRLRNSSNPDKSWKQPEILLWGAAELASGNLCVCFPELGPLLCRGSRLRRNHRGATTSNDIAEAGRPLPDSGIGLSTQVPMSQNGLIQSIRVRILGRSWMDSGLGSNFGATATDRSNGQEMEITPASSGMVIGSKVHGHEVV